MAEDAYVNHVPVLTGGAGKSALRTFYSVDFIPSMPPDTKLTPISRTVGEEQLVDEMIFSFTHTQEMPWMLPGIPPTNRYVEVALVAIVRFRDGKLAHEHIYWDPGVGTQADWITDRPGATGLWRRIRSQRAEQRIALPQVILARERIC